MSGEVQTTEILLSRHTRALRFEKTSRNRASVHHIPIGSNDSPNTLLHLFQSLTSAAHSLDFVQ